MESEMDAIASLLTMYPIIAIDTEYACAAHRPPAACLAPRPRERYAVVKADVDNVPIVQLGITLCDEHGNIPLAADGHELAWEVTFSDFDARRPESVAFQRSQGIDFDVDQARAHGVRSAAFADKLTAVLSATPNRDELTWAAYFHGAYDFAYVVKMLAGGRPLPETWHEFMAQAKALLGRGRVFDAKYMMWHCERVAHLRGLGRVVASLGVRRKQKVVPGLPCRCSAAQKSHTACLIYTAMRWSILDRDGSAGAMAMLEGLIDGLQC